MIEELGWEFIEKTSELYTFMMPSLNVELATMCKDGFEQNGFEVYRKINEEKDPIHENVEFMLYAELQGMVQKRCRTLAETNELFKALEIKEREFREKTGKVI